MAKLVLNFLKESWAKIIIALVFTFALIVFNLFEQVIVFKILVFLFIALALGQLYVTKQRNWMMLIFLFLCFFDLFSLYLGVNWSLGLIMLGVLSVTALAFYFSHEHLTNVSLLYLVLIAILEVEIFLALVPWPIDPKGSSLIAVGAFYFFASVIKLQEEEKLNWRNVLPVLILLVIIGALVVFTTQWYK